MATVTGHTELDMRALIFLGEIDTATASRITIVYGDGVGVFLGAFGYSALGLPQGTLSGFSLRQGGHTVFEATGVERSAATALGIARTGDNDRFLAYTLSGDDLLNGTTGADHLLGFGGDDTAYGGRGDDEIFGGAGDDRLYGGSGDDLLAGGEGVDRHFGDGGDDTYVVDSTKDRVVEGNAAGWDVVLASASFALTANVEELGLTGSAAIDGRGNDAANVIRGNAARNVLLGMDGDDTLAGLPGDDVLIGGRGRDLLSGGRGDDIYRFGSLSDSKPGASRRDKILDFWSGEDRIDLSGIDANSERSGDQAFVFAGEGGFSGRAGELRVAAGRVSADLDGDRAADFQIDIVPNLLLDRDDFIL